MRLLARSGDRQPCARGGQCQLGISNRLFEHSEIGLWISESAVEVQFRLFQSHPSVLKIGLQITG